MFSIQNIQMVSPIYVHFVHLMWISHNSGLTLFSYRCIIYLGLLLPLLLLVLLLLQL